MRAARRGGRHQDGGSAEVTCHHKDPSGAGGVSVTIRRVAMRCVAGLGALDQEAVEAGMPSSVWTPLCTAVLLCATLQLCFQLVMVGLAYGNIRLTVPRKCTPEGAKTYSQFL